jgi:hypothetical protein
MFIFIESVGDRVTGLGKFSPIERFLRGRILAFWAIFFLGRIFAYWAIFYLGEFSPIGRLFTLGTVFKN